MLEIAEPGGGEASQPAQLGLLGRDLLQQLFHTPPQTLSGKQRNAQRQERPIALALQPRNLLRNESYGSSRNENRVVR